MRGQGFGQPAIGLLPCGMQQRTGGRIHPTPDRIGQCQGIAFRIPYTDKSRPRRRVRGLGADRENRDIAGIGAGGQGAHSIGAGGQHGLDTGQR